MKFLTLIRHAKSSWQTGVADHDRPLNERGQRAAPAVATFLHRTYFGGADLPPLLPRPDRLLTSTAVRALATARFFHDAMKLPPDALVLEPRLYLAEARRILEIVQDFSEAWQHVILFGHNPGMHEFAERMPVRAHIPKMPTCTAVLLSVPVPHWGLVDWEEAQLVGYITPKTLEKRFPDLYSGISQQDGEPE